MILDKPKRRVESLHGVLTLSSDEFVVGQVTRFHRAAKELARAFDLSITHSTWCNYPDTKTESTVTVTAVIEQEPLERKWGRVLKALHDEWGFEVTWTPKPIPDDVPGKQWRNPPAFRGKLKSVRINGVAFGESFKAPFEPDYERCAENEASGSISFVLPGGENLEVFSGEEESEDKNLEVFSEKVEPRDRHQECEKGVFEALSKRTGLSIEAVAKRSIYTNLSGTPIEEQHHRILKEVAPWDAPLRFEEPQFRHVKMDVTTGGPESTLVMTGAEDYCSPRKS